MGIICQFHPPPFAMVVGLGGWFDGAGTMLPIAQWELIRDTAIVTAEA